jgi:hypothetical protein
VVFTTKCERHPWQQAAQCPECMALLIEDLVRDQQLRAVKVSPWLTFRLFLWGRLQHLAALLLTADEKQLVTEELDRQDSSEELIEDLKSREALKREDKDDEAEF